MPEEKPLLEKGGELSFRIPEEFAKQFTKELRVIIKPGPTVGIWNPDIEMLGKLAKSGVLKDFDIVITPKKA